MPATRKIDEYTYGFDDSKLRQSRPAKWHLATKQVDSRTGNGMFFKYGNERTKNI
jgi:hypothetical protein